ncbi:MAG: ACT domain-containing protein, partial [Lachnospiraceae bacterium]|nr:ACT domain-containing protein [Lachnospiraceae bacterium]
KTEITLFAHNRIGLLADLSRVLAEGEVDIQSMNTRTSKQGIATVTLDFQTSGVEEINRITTKLRQIEGVMDIQRTTG